MLLSLALAASLMGSVPPADPIGPDYSWWRDARFGMFIHWGLYSEAAGSWKDRFVGGWTEWLLSRAKIDPVEYQRELLPRFDPEKFDARAIARAAKSAGMGYVVVTTKHHEGFCLWDSADSPSDIAMTPFGASGRSLLKELAEACAAEGLKLGFYYSLLDWHDADYLPRRAWDARSVPATSGEDGDASAGYARYAKRMRTHIEELLGGEFGEIAILWGDGDWEHGSEAHQSKALIARARELQPGLLVNNRWAMPGDYDTPENTIPDAPPARAWETCMTMNESWGYTPRVETYKPAAELVRMLADIASKDGNFLLNVGPDGDGLLDAVALERLGEIGEWMNRNGESIRGTRGASTIGAPAVYPWGRLTVRHFDCRVGESGVGAIYIHVFDMPESGEILLPGLAATVAEASVLGVPGIGGSVGVGGAAGQGIEVAPRGGDSVVRVPAGLVAAARRGLPEGVTNADVVVRLDVSSWPPIAGTPVPSAAPGYFMESMALAFDVPAGSEVLVTTDGSTPRIANGQLGATTRRLVSRDDVVTLTCTSRVRARAVVRGELVGSEFAGTYTLATPWPAVAAAVMPAGFDPARDLPPFRVAVIEGGPGEFDRVPALERFQKPTRVLSIGLKPGGQSLQLPDGLPEDNYGLLLEGFIVVPETGIWEFSLTSDDGSRLWIDGKEVIDNDGPHGAKEVRGQAPLAAGIHLLRVGYFEAGGAANLEVGWGVVESGGRGGSGGGSGAPPG